MPDCNYNYDFFSQPYTYNPNLNTPGVYPADRLKRVLSCCTDSDKWTELFLSEIVEIPEASSDIQDIIEISSCVDIILQEVVKKPLINGYISFQGPVSGENISNFECTNLTGKKLIIEGILNQRIIYNIALGGQSLYSSELLQPFSAFIIIEADTPISQKFNISVFIEDVFAGAIPQRTVFKNTTLFIKASKSC